MRGHATLFLSRVEEKPRETNNLGLRLQQMKDRKQYDGDFTIPYCYISAYRHPSDALRTRLRSTVIGVETKPNNDRILVRLGTSTKPVF